MGRLDHDQDQFFYSLRLDEAVQEDHAVRAICQGARSNTNGPKR